MASARKFVFALVAVVALAPLSGAADFAQLRNGFTIRHDHRATMGQTTRLYLSTSDTSYVDIPTDEIVGYEHDDSPIAVQAAPAPASNDIGHIVDQTAARNQLDPALVNSVIRAESNFNPRAVSPKGAQGLMQLMPSTATKLGVKNAFEPAANVDGGTRYLRDLLVQYHGDMAKALAAYNAGPQRVLQYRGVPPYRETHAYVTRVIRDFNRRKVAQNPSLKPATRPARKVAASRSSKQVAHSKSSTSSAGTP